MNGIEGESLSGQSERGQGVALPLGTVSNGTFVQMKVLGAWSPQHQGDH